MTFFALSSSQVPEGIIERPSYKVDLRLSVMFSSSDCDSPRKRCWRTVKYVWEGCKSFRARRTSAIIGPQPCQTKKKMEKNGVLGCARFFFCLVELARNFCCLNPGNKSVERKKCFLVSGKKGGAKAFDIRVCSVNTDSTPGGQIGLDAFVEKTKKPWMFRPSRLLFSHGPFSSQIFSGKDRSRISERERRNCEVALYEA